MAITAVTHAAERFSYGTPIDRFADTPVPLVPRAGTALASRILIAAIFLTSGIAKLTDGGHAAQYMSAVGIPHADVLAIVAGCVEVLGGLSILVGFLARLGAFGLFVFLIPTTILFHGGDVVQIMKNLAIMGGLLSVVAYGPGRFSIDHKLRKPLAP